MKSLALAASVVWQVARLARALGLAGLKLALARRKALKAFRRGLAEMGLTRDAIQALSREYPSLNVHSVVPARPRGRRSS